MIENFLRVERLNERVDFGIGKEKKDCYTPIAFSFTFRVNLYRAISSGFAIKSAHARPSVRRREGRAAHASN